MTQFELWYAFYDSLFLCNSPSLPQNFCLAHTINKNEWPVQPCPALSQCFAMLEQFLSEGDNWVSSRCTIEELNATSENLNVLSHFLCLEKQYACEFWLRDSRRVQASITHLYCFLQQLGRAIIPYPSMTIFECKAAYKLCVHFSKLEHIFSQILKRINELAAFLSTAYFEEERAIIVNFFKNFVSLLKQMPNIKRSKLTHVHELSKLIAITNPLEICSAPAEVKRRNRKKSCTIGTVHELELSTADAVLLRANHPKKYRKFEDFYYRIQKRSISCQELRGEGSQKDTKEKLLKIFVFPDRINLEAQNTLMRKKNTLNSLRTLTTKIDSISKNKSNTMASINSPATIKRIKTSTAVPQGRPLKKKNTSIGLCSNAKVLFIEQEEEKFQLNSASSSKNTEGAAFHKSHEALEAEKARESSRVLAANGGKSASIYRKRSRGWEVLRAHFWERVWARKLRKIMCMPLFVNDVRY